MNKKMPRPIALIILDGWGHRTDSEHNPISNTATPTFDKLFNEHPHTLLHASGEAVGLPPGQMGNSEVGHLHIGAGRKILQDLSRINESIKTEEFSQNKTFLQAIELAKQKNSAIHILGLLSPGGVHSHEQHIMALIKLIGEHGITQNYFHALLDGRDTPPKSAEPSLQKVSELYATLPGGQIAHVIGRYFAMDRDRRWERTQKAYDCLTGTICEYSAKTATEALNAAYERGETDEFVTPTAILRPDGDVISVHDNDIIIFMNFRADRARQLTRAFIESDFEGFKRTFQPKLADYITLTEYDKNYNVDTGFPPPQITNSLGEYLSKQGLTQLRAAETEKYAHVTYFVNGGTEAPFQNEDRLLVPSPKVATYDLQPEMSALELTHKLCDAIRSEKYDVIICNYANPDMIGHTGVEAAANSAVTTMDNCMHKVLTALHQVGGEALITSDHGNIEIMYNKELEQPHTAHTSNRVPLIYVGRPAKFVKKDGALDDIAPTLLRLLQLTPPAEMTGQALLELDS